MHEFPAVEFVCCQLQVLLFEQLLNQFIQENK